MSITAGIVSSGRSNRHFVTLLPVTVFVKTCSGSRSPCCLQTVRVKEGTRSVGSVLDSFTARASIQTERELGESVSLSLSLTAFVSTEAPTCPLVRSFEASRHFAVEMCPGLTSAMFSWMTRARLRLILDSDNAVGKSSRWMERCPASSNVKVGAPEDHGVP